MKTGNLMSLRKVTGWGVGFLLLLLGGLQGPLACRAESSGTDKFLAEVLSLVGSHADGELLIKAGDKVSFMGDSITAQAGYLRLTAYVLRTLKIDLPPFVNAGIGGQKAESMEPRFEKDMKLSEKPAWVFISVGINDVWHRVSQPHDPKVLADYEANVNKMVEKGLAGGAHVVLLTPTLIQEDPNSEGNKRLPLYVEAMRKIAAEKKCQVVDLHEHFLKAMVNRTKPVRITSDGVHMAAYGDAIMAIGVLRSMGVSDASIAATDVTPILQVRNWGMSTTTAARLLEVPVERFAKPELSSFIGF